MAMTEDQKKKMDELYEKMVNESARELASHRTPCEEFEKLKIVSRMLNTIEKGNKVEFPPDEAVQYRIVRDGEFIVPSIGKEEEEEEKGTNSK